jgi:hypothetical protein
MSFIASRNKPASDDIITFHPVHLHLPGATFDALLDALNPWGACFFVMIEGLVPGRDAAERDTFFSSLGRVELEWGRAQEAWRIPCRVRGYSLDQEGLVAYMALRFLDSDPVSRRALEEFMASLW